MSYLQQFKLEYTCLLLINAYLNHMNLKNLIMWAIIVLLSVGLFNMFQDPKKINAEKNKLPFSEFLNEVDSGRVVEVQIQGNNISGILSDGKSFNTYSPNYPELVDKLNSNEVSIIASPTEDKMPSLLGILLSWFPMLLLIGVWIFFMRQMQEAKVAQWDLEDLKQNY